ncbi:MAG: fructosamine kinase [Planctomycetes bacterium]|nr:fructosamine kinase [Planctomycetota bacterium]
MLPGDVDAAIRAATGQAVAQASAIGGGDINEARRVVLADGRALFLKFHPGCDPEMFPAEARGLRWLADAGALRVPDVVAVSSATSSVGFLLLELLESAPRTRGFDEALGQGLAAMHRAGADTFGLDHDNFIGRLTQSNSQDARWPTFYRDRRLAPQIAQAAARGLLDDRTRRALDDVLGNLDGLCGPAEPPARLHGDLWGGNLHVSADGEPALIDPAVYGGHREVDLAMMRLFGGFEDRVFEAYAESWPLADGWRERVPLYQLYPLLVHVNLFGGAYAGNVARAAAALIYR